MTAPESSERDRQHTARLVAAAIIVVLVIWLAVANRQRVEVDFIVATENTRLIIVIVVSALLGTVADRLIQWRRKRD